MFKSNRPSSRLLQVAALLAAGSNLIGLVDAGNANVMSAHADFDMPQLVGTGVNVAKMAPYQDQGLANRGAQLVYNPPKTIEELQECFVPTGGGGTTQTTIISEGAYEFSNALAGEAGLKGEIGAFKGSVDAAVSMQSDKHSSRYFARSTLVHTDAAISYQLKCLNSADRVAPAFLNVVQQLAVTPLPERGYCDEDLEKWQPFFNFLGSWGTHLVTGVVSGASFDILMSETKSSMSNSSSIAGSLTASYEACSVNGTAKIDNKEAKTERDQMVQVTVLGGSILTQMELSKAANEMLTSPASKAGPKIQGLGNQMTAWMESVQESMSTHAIINAKYVPWDNVIPVMGTILGGDDVAAKLAFNLARAAITHMKLQWKDDCPAGQWNDETLKCEYKIPQLIERTSNMPNFIIANGQYLMFNDKESELQLIDDKSNATQFELDVSTPSEPRLFLLDPLGDRLGALIAGGESSPTKFMLGAVDSSGSMARLMVTANEGIRLQNSRDYLTIQGSNIILKNYEFGTNPSSDLSCQFSFVRPVREMTPAEIQPLNGKSFTLTSNVDNAARYLDTETWNANTNIKKATKITLNMIGTTGEFKMQVGASGEYLKTDEETGAFSLVDADKAGAFALLDAGKGQVLIRNEGGKYIGVAPEYHSLLAAFSTTVSSHTMWTLSLV